jgi:guanosine-3',5'-bis(diphosphate) 3'-pyrophosphohydrolase
MMRQYELVERVQRYKPDVNEALLNKAYVYAMQKHGHQKRASGDPYFSHPLEVAAILTDMRLDEATIAVALLHDTIEDTSATRAEIDELFGPEMGKLVEGLTKLKKLDLVSRKAEQAENLRKLLLAISEDVRVLLVKLADRLHNMRTLGHMREDKRLRIAEETMEIYAPLAGRMGMQGMREELEELAFRYINPEAHRMVTQRLAEISERARDVLSDIEKALSELFDKYDIRAEVTSRPRRCPSSSFPTYSASASWSTGLRTAISLWARSTPHGRWCRAASRTIFPRRSRTATSRSTPPSLGRRASVWNSRFAPAR